MTILFGYIGRDKAAIASDGNIVRNCDDTIISGDCDKTFSLLNGKVIGGFANNTSIDHSTLGKGISIRAVLGKVAENFNGNCFSDLIDFIIKNYLDSIVVFP